MFRVFRCKYVSIWINPPFCAPLKVVLSCSMTARREALGKRGCDVDSGTTLQMRLSISLSFCSPDTLFVKFPAIYGFIVK